MNSQGQLQRTHGHHQTEEPIRIHHPEEEGHHEKGPSKVLKKVKEKAKKIKNVLTKHGHGQGHEHDRGEQHIPDDHDLDEEDDEDYDVGQQVHGGAPARGKAHHISDPMKEDIVPPGTKFFPVVSSSHTKPSEPSRGVAPVRGSNVPHGHESLSHPVRASGVSGKEDKRGAATLTPHNTPVSLLPATEDVTRTFVPGEQRKVNIERPRALEEDPAAPGKGSGVLGGMSNYQSKVTVPTGKAGGEIGASSTIAALRRKGTDEDDQIGLGRDLPVKGHGFDSKSGPEMGEQLPAGKYRSEMGEQLPAGKYRSGVEKFPTRSHETDAKSGADLPIGTHGIRDPEGFDSKDQQRGDEMHQPNRSSYTDKIASVTSVVADKAAAAKNVVASKLGYSGEAGHESRVEGAETPGSGDGYGNKVASMVTPVYEKVKETGASVMTKLSGSGTGTETEIQQGQDKGVSAKEYLTEKLSPGEEDKALSEVVAEKLHLGGDTAAPAKRGTVTQSEEVEKRLGGFSDPKSEGAMKHGEAVAGEGEGGMVDKLKEAVTSWISGTTEEVTQKSTESVQDSSQSVGATVGNMGFSGSGADGAGQRSGDKSGSVPVQKRFQDSGN